MAKKKKSDMAMTKSMLWHLIRSEQALIRAHKMQKSLKGHIGASADEIDEMKMLLSRLHSQIQAVKESLCEGG